MATGMLKDVSLKLPESQSDGNGTEAEDDRSNDRQGDRFTIAGHFCSIGAEEKQSSLYCMLFPTCMS